MALQNTPSAEISRIADAQRAFFATGKTKDVGFRREMLRRLGSSLRKWEAQLCDALRADLNKSYEEAFMTEIGILYGEIGEAEKKVGKWSRRKRVHTPMTVMPSGSYIVREPLGCTLIVSPWNYPVQLLLNPLVGAIAAGCTAILKPSPYVPTVSSVLESFIRDTFPEEYVALVQGDRSVNAELFSQRFDLVFFTGSPALAKVLMEAQARYLTPMVLELGGKSPCIVDKDADIAVAAKRIAWGKCLNSGQTCIAPDYLFLHEDIKEKFIGEFRKAVAELYPEGTQHSQHYVHMVRDKAFDRVTGYLSCGKVVAGGHSDPSTRWIEPTLLDGVSPDSPVMTEEIFGPIFPIMTFSEISGVEEFITSREKPLALYYFGKEASGWDVISSTSSGGACINDTIMHIANSCLPFGGVGNSGMGNYHRERSFLAFTHERSVLSTPTWIDLPFRYMPYKFFSLAKRLLSGGGK